MLARPTCRNITAAPPPARPVHLHRPALIRRRTRRGATFALWVRQALTRGAAGIVNGMLAGCLAGLVLGAATGILVFVVLLASEISWSNWSELIGLLCLSGIFLTVIAAVIGAITGVVPGLLVGGMAGAASALLRGGLAGRIAGLVLGSTLSPLLLAGSTWANPVIQVMMVVPGALGGFRVAAVVGEKTRHLA